MIRRKVKKCFNEKRRDSIKGGEDSERRGRDLLRQASQMSLDPVLL